MMTEPDPIFQSLSGAFSPHAGAPSATAITRGLVDGLFASLADSKEEKDPWLKENTTTLRQLVDCIYPPAGAEPDEQASVEILKNITPESREKVTIFLARIGHLHQMASMMAREALLEKNADQDVINTFLKSTVSKPTQGSRAAKTRTPSPLFRDASEACNALSRPVLELTFTGHPTNTNGLDFMKAQRQLIKAVNDWRRTPNDAAKTDTLKTAFMAFGTTPILPRAEKKIGSLMVADETDSMLYALQNAYDGLDDAYGKFDAALTQKYRVGYAPETLNLNVRFNSWGSSGDKDGNQNVNADTTLHALAKHRLAILTCYAGELEKLGTPLPEALKPWVERITTAKTVFEKAVDELNKKLQPGVFLTTEETDQIRKDLVRASQTLDAKAFEEALENAYQATTKEEPNKKPLLRLLRHVRHFGFSLGKIEYRETADEYQRILAAVVEGYDKMDEAARSEKLTEMLQNPEKLADLQQKLAALAAAGHGKRYDAKNPAPIAYHTLKRMELARDFPDMIAANVLAECQGVSNMLEALVLQQAVAVDGKRPLLNIVPLFEEYSTLSDAPKVMQAAMTNPAYQQHIEALQAVGDGREKAQVQIAHSDNSRRAGAIGARAAIYDAQAKLQEQGIQRYQGGSQSDPYRDGVRSVSAKINEYGLHEFAKMTFQGGDLLNYFNAPHSGERLVTKNITASALALIENKRTEDLMTKEDRNIAPALKATIGPYEALFNGDALNELLTAIDYNRYKDSGNFSSRAASRGTAPGTVEVTKARTISYSEALQHAGFSPILIGAKGLYDNIDRQLKTVDENATPETLNKYYDASPLFRDVVDRLLFALARTSFTPLESKLNAQQIGLLQADYKDAYRVALEAYTGKAFDPESYPKRDSGDPDFKAMRQHVIKEVFPHAQEFFATQDRLMRGAHEVWNAWHVRDNNEADFKQSALAHNIIDTVHHGRNWLLDDPSAAAIYRQEQRLDPPPVRAR